MNLKYILALMIVPIFFSSCNREEVFGDEVNNIIKLNSVRLDGFCNGQLSRSTYSGYATSFENTDQLGLILIDNSGNQTGNVPFTYSAEGWKNDNMQYYSSDIDKIIAYFPYNRNLSTEITTLDGLKNSIEISNDQSDLENFKSMDLLVCEISVPSPALDLLFKHAFSLIDLSAISSVTVDDETFSFNVELSNPAFSIGGTMYNPCGLNGSYVCLVKDDQNLKQNDFRYFYSVGGKSHVKTVNAEINLEAGTRYTFPCIVGGQGTKELSAGDFYCVSNSGNNVILPDVASNIPEGLTCKGIVFHVMGTDEWGTFTSTNDLTAENLSGYNGNHGLVVSIANGNPFGTMTVEQLQNVFTDDDTSSNKDLSNGYKLTGILADASTTDGNISFTALSNHTEELYNCTSWYVPSFNELKYLIRGEDIANISVSGMEYINGQLEKVENSNQIVGNVSSITFDKGFCIMQNGDEMGWHGVPDESVRPICAF